MNFHLIKTYLVINIFALWIVVIIVAGEQRFLAITSIL